MPNGLMPPLAFGMSTRRTGGGSSSLRTFDSRACRGCPTGGLEVFDRLSVYACRSLVNLHTLEGFPDFPLGDQKRLCLVHGFVLSPVGPWPRLKNAAPWLQPHYRTFNATTGCSVTALRVGTLALAIGAACGLSLHAAH